MNKGTVAPGSRAPGAWYVRGGRRTLEALLFLTAICVFVPFSPLMPGADLDQSWILAMNQAMAQGLAIGRDIVFTVGPYASIFTARYHPDIDHLRVLGALYLGLSFGFALTLASRGRRWYLPASLAVVLAGVMNSRDALFLTYPILVAVLCCRLTNDSDHFGFSNRWRVALTVMLFLPFGLLAAIKGTFLMLCVPIAALAGMMLLAGRNWILAAALLASVGLSTVVFWLLAGQSLPDLPRYLKAITELSAGYTEAMALPGAAGEIVCFLVAAATQLAAIAREHRIPIRRRAFLFLSSLVFLFLVFKGSFVRHDSHATLAGASTLIGALLLALALPRSRWVLASIFMAFLTWAYIESHYVNVSTRSLGARFGYSYAMAWQGIKYRITSGNRLQQEYQSALQQIQSHARIRPLQGTTDIYSYGQSQLIASGNRWHPRPIFQSYSAYTPALANRNNRHLIDDTAPDNIVFRLEPLDGRVPSLDDGPSWASLLTHYRLVAAEHDWLYLRRSKAPDPVAGGQVITNGRFSLGDIVPVPDNSAAVFASMSIRPTLLGRLMGILYKPEQLQITLQLADGTTRPHRLISGMARAGFLISPWVQSTADFGALYGGVEYLAGQEVVSFSIRSKGESGHWEESFDVVLRQAAAVEPMDIRHLSLYEFDPVFEARADQRVLAAERCEGGFDAVNGASPPPPSFTAFGKLALHGWMAQALKPGLVPETMFVVLSDEHGRNLLFRTRRTARPDVGRHFDDAALDASGFAATIDVATVRGEFFLGLAYLDNGRIMMCPRSASRGSFKGIKSLAPG